MRDQVSHPLINKILVIYSLTLSVIEQEGKTSIEPNNIQHHIKL